MCIYRIYCFAVPLPVTLRDGPCLGLGEFLSGFWCRAAGGFSMGQSCREVWTLSEYFWKSSASMSRSCLQRGAIQQE